MSDTNDLTPAQQEEQYWEQVYQNTFLRDHETLDVLDDILREASFFSTLAPDDAGQIALHNLCKVILKKMGIWKDDKTKTIIERLASTTIKKEEPK